MVMGFEAPEPPLGLKPEDDFADLIWGENKPVNPRPRRRKISGRPWPSLPDDRRIPRETSFSKYLREKQRKIEEAEAAEILSFNKRKERMKALIMNVILPMIVVFTILFFGALYVIPDKKEKSFEKQVTTGETSTTMQLQETPKKGSPTITRSE